MWDTTYMWTMDFTIQSLNLQAWRIPLWASRLSGNAERIFGLNLQAWRIPLWVLKRISITKSMNLSLNLQAWRIPLWDTPDHTIPRSAETGLNLQAWRIPLWAHGAAGGSVGRRVASQPPSLENPFVGGYQALGMSIADVQSQPPSLENPFVGDRISFTLKYT